MDLSPEQNPESELAQSRWWSPSMRRRSHKRSFGRIRSPMLLGLGRSDWSRSPKENLGSLRRIQYPWELELDDLIDDVGLALAKRSLELRSLGGSDAFVTAKGYEWSRKSPDSLG